MASLPLLPDVQCLENLISCILSGGVIISGGWVDPALLTPSLPEVDFVALNINKLMLTVELENGLLNCIFL